ncbi:MAG: T9SS type A sorting domain-containing protein [Lewinellaceae bacterium]|nr:T9SS type A sorting domain-containing protein [Sinomicrobium sp.]MCB9293034.1 T9SS type A sorting domain-containing protein [Lewinellaceae bacterium]
MYYFGFDLYESDAHVVKQTHPIRPDTGLESDEGFIRDDENGTVYIGEGNWGAPLRDNNDNKSWTRASGSFNQFNWIFVDQEKIEIRTIRTDHAQQVAEVSQSDIFEPPKGLIIWNPPTGNVVTLRNRKTGSPSPGSGTQPPIATLENDQPNSRPASTSSDIPREPEPAGDNPSDWSPFPKVTPNEKGDITIQYYLPQDSDVSIQLINPKWQPVARMDFPGQKRGNHVKNLNLSRVPAGKYLLVIKGGDRLSRRFQVIVR